MEWYYIGEDKNILGPFPLYQIDNLQSEKTIDDNTYMFTDGMKEWKQLKRVKEIISKNIDHLFLNEEEIKLEEQVIEDKEIKKEIEYNSFITSIQRNDINNNTAENDNEIKNLNSVEENAINNNLALNENSNIKLSKSNKDIIKSTHLNKEMSEEEIRKNLKTIKKFKKYKEKKKEQWYNSKLNSFVYVSCLPKEITKKDLHTFFSICGKIRNDKDDNWKIKLYKDDNGENKGDAVVSFSDPKSVDAAVRMLNGAEIIPGYHVNVEKAKFEQKDSYVKRK